MANTDKYLGHLLQTTGITPACSEEEQAAANDIARIFSNHGFQPEIQEFSASGTDKLVQAVLGIVLFVGAVLMGIAGPVGVVGFLLAVAAAVVLTLERNGHPVFSQLGHGGLSQNVIAYHKASGPLASPRNRPVVVVAHYDSPRVDLLAQEPYAAWRPVLTKLLPYAVIAAAAIAVVRLLPLPGAAKVVLWLLGIVCALVPLAFSIAAIANRFVLSYTTGSVCNKSSVAALMGVMDAVAPFEGRDEFPDDVPAEEYFAEQRRIVEEAAAAAAAAAAEAEAAAAAQNAYPHELAEEAEASDGEESAEGTEGTEQTQGPAAEEAVAATGFIGVPGGVSADAVQGADAAPADKTVGFEVVNADSTVTMDAEELAAQAGAEVEEPVEEEGPFTVNAAGNIRFGAEAIRSLGMLPESCAIVYDEPEADSDAPAASENAPVFDDPAYDAEDAVEFAAEDEAEPAFDEESFEPSFEDEAEPETLGDEDTGFEGEDSDSVEEEPVAEHDLGETDASKDDFEQLNIFANVDAATSEPPVEGEPAAAELVADAPVATEPAPAPADTAVEHESQVEPVDEASASEPEVPESAPAPVGPGATQVYQAVPASASAASGEPERTVALPVQPAQPVETVDSLMAEISHHVAPKKAPVRSMNVPDPAAPPTPVTPAGANRASLFDLPDPSSTPVDPFASMPEPGAASAPAAAPAPASEGFETISAPAPEQEKPRRGLGRLFGRKKKKDDSMSQWLGVDDDFDAKRSGGDIGSWDNFDDNDHGWKGGATGVEGVTEDDLREAVTSLGDDELLGHDIWFVAAGASEHGNAGVRAFLNEHRDKLRGVFLINLECVGAGRIAMLATEGERRVLKGDKRIMKLVSRVSSDFHNECGAVDMPYVTTDAHAAMEMSLRSLTLAGVEGTGFALSHTAEDQPYNVDPQNVSMVADVVTEVIRRS